MPCHVVAAALISAPGRVYTGVCFDTASTLGICAEPAAIAELDARESEIALGVSVSAKFGILGIVSRGLSSATAKWLRSVNCRPRRRAPEAVRCS